jgi:hypothetical protein
LSRLFERPVFIIAMPRSGSTLLFDLLKVHPKLASWGDEAYPPWSAVDPELGSGPQGDALRSATPDAAAYERVMQQGVIAHHGRVPWRSRLLDKTPPSVLRVPALQSMFPDAVFIHLVRDAPDNIASLLEGRDQRLAVRDWPHRNGMEWHFLMPPGWTDHLGEAPAQQFAWQWEVGTGTPLRDLSDCARIRYEDLVAQPEEAVEDLLEYAGLRMSREVLSACRAMAPSKHTLSAPAPDKWRERAAEIEPVLDGLAELRRELGYRY